MANPSVVYPLTDEGIFSAVFRCGPLRFKVLCEDILRISSVGLGPFLPGTTTRTAPAWRKADSILKRLSRQGLIVSSRTEGWKAYSAVAEADLLCDLLCCVTDPSPTELVIEQWTPWDRALCALWAWQTHFYASDCNVRVPPLPSVLTGYHL